MTLERLADLLESDGLWSKGGGVDRKVVDRTGLEGEFDVRLNWPWNTSPRTSDGLTLFTALREQLGLKLESTRGPVDVLVIDSVQKPTEN